jgi:hypothetical protein
MSYFRNSGTHKNSGMHIQFQVVLRNAEDLKIVTSSVVADISIRNRTLFGSKKRPEAE